MALSPKHLSILPAFAVLFLCPSGPSGVAAQELAEQCDGGEVCGDNMPGLAPDPATRRTESILLQMQRKVEQRMADTEGLMTMWSDSATTIVGGSCEYANAAQGGLSAPSAGSPYVATKGYCAVDSAMYQGGGACGACYRVAYDGSPATDPGTAGSMVVQIVDSGSAKTFDCQVTAFEAITGATTGVFPITYEPVDCETSGDMVVTVLDGNNAWYTKVVFSNLPQAVASARLIVDGATFTMSRASGATWYASPGGKVGAATFSVTLSGGATVTTPSCFSEWPVPTNTHCSAAAASATTDAAATTATTTTSTAAATTTIAASATTTPTANLAKTCAVGKSISKGDSVYLEAHTGHIIAVDGETVHARWANKGSWEKLTVDTDGSGALQAGQTVWLKSHTGNYITCDGTTLRASWSNRLSWEAFVVETDDGDGPICDGDAIFLRAHTGMTITVEGTEVHASWSNKFSWERLVIQKA